MALLLRALIWLNVLDTLLTFSLVSLKWASEANPIMDYFLQRGPLVFGAAKLTMTLAGTFLLWKSRKSKWSVRAAGAMVMCYLGVVTYEMVMLMAILFSQGVR